MSLNLALIREELVALVAAPSEALRSGMNVLREPTPSHDMGDTAVAVVNKEVTARRIDTEYVKRLQARVSIQRIDDGTYGTCLTCGAEIAEKRILAQKHTPFCLECQEKLDGGELEPEFDRYRIPGPVVNYHRVQARHSM